MSSAGPVSGREFELMLEAAFVNGAVSPATVREMLSRNYGRYNMLYRAGSKKGSKDPKPTGKEKKTKKGSKTPSKVSGSIEPKTFEVKDVKSFDFFGELNDEEQKEIIDLQTALFEQATVPENREFVVTEKQAKKDNILFGALSAKKVPFFPKDASEMRRKGNAKPSDRVIALEKRIGMTMYIDMAAKKGLSSKLNTIGKETADWLSDLSTEEQNVLRPFVRVPASLKVFFREPEISKKSKE